MRIRRLEGSNVTSENWEAFWELYRACRRVGLPLACGFRIALQQAHCDMFSSKDQRYTEVI